MKNLLIFLFGVGVGAGGTLLWLRKDIKKELENMKKNEEVPFVYSDADHPNGYQEKGPKTTDPSSADDGTIPVKPATDRLQYQTPVTPGESDLPEDEEESRDPEGGFNETDGGILEIDEDTYLHDHEKTKERLVFFRGDQIMSTEEGTIITRPATLVGSEWENCVGNFADRTAFIRNSRLVTDYEIYVEEGLYEDEYGMGEDYRED